MMESESVFAILPRVALFTYVALASIAIVAVVRRKAQWVAPWLAVVITLATAIMYWRLWFVRIPRVDRLRGEIDEPVHSLRLLAARALITLALCVLYIAITRGRIAALTTAVFLNAGLLHLFWVVLFLPLANDWRPFDWNRPDLLIPMRACRGATLWSYAGRNYVDIGAIDDIWLQFADPRNGNAPTFAVSARGRWRGEYYWLNSSDLHAMRVRRDDPAVIDCDTRTRAERVTPATWHTLGFEW